MGTVTKKASKRWQDDEDFVAALKKRGYLDENGGMCMSNGIYLYMWELFQDGIECSQSAASSQE